MVQVIYKQSYSTGFIQRTDIDLSILGPLLFVLFINDLPLNVHTRNDGMFADDTTLLTSSYYINVEELKNTLPRR